MDRFSRYSRLIVLPHSVFALPFALASFALALHRSSAPFSFSQLSLIVAAVVAARATAMAFNRAIDAKFDAINVRTQVREIPRGEITVGGALRFATLSGVAFLLCAYLLGWHCFILAPFVLGLLLFYSWTKRFTQYSHLFLGLALALAPGGAWWVVRPQIEVVPLLLMSGVLFWVAGFDVLYSCQDVEFDRREGLRSIPARCGVENALKVAKLLHLLAFGMFLLVGFGAQLSSYYFLGLAPIAALLIYQHTLISAHDLSRINRAFFTMNGWVSVCYLALVLIVLAL